MKHDRSRHRHARRNATPAVICLPPPKPPYTPPRQSALAIPLTDEAEPLAVTPAQQHETRQMRRQAMRAQAKAARRGGDLLAIRPSVPANAVPAGQPVEPVSETVVIAVDPQIEPVIDTAPVAETVAQPGPDPAVTGKAPDTASAPLPRNRSLVTAKARGFWALLPWLRPLVMTRRPRRAPLSSQSAVEQLQALRLEIASVQRTLDRLLENAAA